MRKCGVCNILKENTEFRGLPERIGRSTTVHACIECAREQQWLQAFPAPKRCVYLIQGADLWKIGYSENLPRRLAGLRTMSPVPLYLDHVWAVSDKSVETALHKQYRRKRDHGEWFRLSPETIAQLKRAPLPRLVVTSPRSKSINGRPRLLRL